MKQKFIITILFLSILFSITNCVIAEKEITRKQALEDALFLQDKLETVHLDLYHNFSQDRAEAMFSKIKNKIGGENSWSKRELYQILTPYVASFGDAHTSLNIGSEFYEYCENGEIFPLLIEIEENDIFVISDLGSGEIPAGSEIIFINGITAEDIISTMKAGISHEREEFAENKLENAFPIFIWAFFNFNGDYQFKYKDVQGEIQSVSCQGIGLKRYKQQKYKLYPLLEKNWTLSYPDNKVALLTINTFASNYKARFKEFMDKSFKEINKKKINNLIIDLRHNGGGSTELSDYLYKYLTSKPSRTFAEVHVRYSGPVIKEKKIFNPLTLFKVKILGNKTIIHKNDFESPPATEHRFQGDIYLLTGPGTFSTAVDLAAMVKDFNVGTIVGTETGGLASTYGDSFSTRLPNSGLTLAISYKYFLRPAGFDNDRGVIPDIRVKRCLSDKIKGEDPVLERVMEIIENK